MPLPIADYALIGNTRTAALVGRDGSIDWLCLPRFDSAACFAALLGQPEHGRWLLAPTGEIRQICCAYRADSLVLETDFETTAGAVRLIDGMPLEAGRNAVVRVVQGLRGQVAMRMELVIRFDYGHIVPWVSRRDGALVAIAGPDALELRTPVEHHSTALLGIVTAFLGVFLSHRLNNPYFDGAASIGIGLILAAVALLLAYESKGLLVGESTDPDIVRHIHDLARADPAVDAVRTPLTMHFGPEQVLVNMDIQFRPELSAHDVENAIDRLEKTIRAAHPHIKRIYIEAEALSARGRRIKLHRASASS